MMGLRKGEVAMASFCQFHFARTCAVLKSRSEDFFLKVIALFKVRLA